jgi:PAS domain-containing protein
METVIMKLPSPDKLDTLEAVQVFFDEIPDGMLLLDRRGRVHLANRAIEQLMQRPNDQIIKKSFGDTLGCIHTGDHPDGCGYGSICGDCFLLKAVKQTLRTRKPVQDVEGSLAMGIKDKGVVRPHLKSSVSPLTHHKRLYLIMSIIGTGDEET